MCNILFLMEEALLSIILVGYGHLANMLIALEPYDIFGAKFEYLFNLTLSKHCYANQLRGFAEHHFSWSRSVGENAYNS